MAYDQYSDEELAAIAGGGGGKDLSSMSNEELMQIAGVSPAKQISPYDLLGQDASASERFGRTAVGGLSKLIPFNLGDEAIAGASALAKGLGGVLGLTDDPNFSLSNTYDQKLNEIRDYKEAFDKMSPGAGLSVDVLGSLALPFKSSVFTKAGVVPKLVQAAKEGAALGGAYGFGAGEGTQDRLNLAKDSAIIGSIFSPIVTGGTMAAGKALDYAGDQFLRMAQNVQRSDLQKAAKFAGKSSSKESPLSSALTAANKKGVFGMFDDASANIDKNEGFIRSLGDEVTGLLKAADDVQKDVSFPASKRTDEFLAKHPFEAETLSNQLERRWTTISELWDGTISGANKIKQYLYNIGYKNTTDSADLDKAIAADFREFIEQQVDQLAPTSGSKVKALNAEQGQHLTLRDLLQKNKFREEMPGGPAIALRRLAVSPVGGAALGGLGGLYLGDTETALKGAALGAAASKPGQMGLSKLSSLLGEGATALAPKLAPLVADLPSVFRSKKNKESSQSDTVDSGSPVEESPQIFPSASFPEVTGKNMTEQKIPAKLSEAIKQVESTGDEKAISYKNGKPIAVGTHQVTPIAMREVMRASAIDDSDFSDAELRKMALEPGVSKEYGEAYMAMMLKRYNNDVELAAAAYNGGPSYIDKLLKKTGGKTFDDIKPYLYEETAKYVPKITKLLKA